MGEGHLACLLNPPTWVNPHIHGGRFVLEKKITTLGGQSPYTWGKALILFCSVVSARSIPIYMGEGLPTKIDSDPLKTLNLSFLFLAYYIL